MNNLPLQPLVWSRIDTEKLAAIYCQKTDSYIKDAVSFCSTPVADYVIRKDSKTGKYRTNYGGRTENPYDTIDEAEHWAEFTHYASQMQPYVKPSPTWIDVSERLPDKEDFYLVYLFDGHREANVVDILYWNADHQQFLEWDFMNNVTHWMPLPSPPEGE